jgi:hypothetical protein
VNKFRSGFKNLVVLAKAMLREIFDESAYQRFLERRQLPSSAAAYGDFRREIEATMARRPKCC